MRLAVAPALQQAGLALSCLVVVPAAHRLQGLSLQDPAFLGGLTWLDVATCGMGLERRPLLEKAGGPLRWMDRLRCLTSVLVVWWL